MVGFSAPPGSLLSTFNGVPKKEKEIPVEGELLPLTAENLGVYEKVQRQGGQLALEDGKEKVLAIEDAPRNDMLALMVHEKKEDNEEDRLAVEKVREFLRKQELLKEKEVLHFDDLTLFEEWKDTKRRRAAARELKRLKLRKRQVKRRVIKLKKNAEKEDEMEKKRKKVGRETGLGRGPPVVPPSNDDNFIEDEEVEIDPEATRNLFGRNATILSKVVLVPKKKEDEEGRGEVKDLQELSKVTEAPEEVEAAVMEPPPEPPLAPKSTPVNPRKTLPAPSFSGPRPSIVKSSNKIGGRRGQGKRKFEAVKFEENVEVVDEEAPKEPEECPRPRTQRKKAKMEEVTTPRRQSERLKEAKKVVEVGSEAGEKLARGQRTARKAKEQKVEEEKASTRRRMTSRKVTIEEEEEPRIQRKTRSRKGVVEVASEDDKGKLTRTRRSTQKYDSEDSEEDQLHDSPEGSESEEEQLEPKKSPRGRSTRKVEASEGVEEEVSSAGSEDELEDFSALPEAKKKSKRVKKDKICKASKGGNFTKGTFSKSKMQQAGGTKASRGAEGTRKKLQKKKSDKLLKKGIKPRSMLASHYRAEVKRAELKKAEEEAAGGANFFVEEGQAGYEEDSVNFVEECTLRCFSGGIQLPDLLNITERGLRKNTRSFSSKKKPPLEDFTRTGALEELLEEGFGFSAFREGQKEAVTHLLQGKGCLVTLPTGTGKSLIYQLFALACKKAGAGLVVVVSPLIALIEDQLNQLPKCVVGAKLVSAQSWDHQRIVLEAVENRLIDVLFLTPERIASENVPWHSFPPVQLLCVDESHCISEWGHSFRPSYLKLPQLCFSSVKARAALCLTATARPDANRDMIEGFGLKHHVHGGKQTTLRKNLKMKVVEVPRNKGDSLMKIFLEDLRSSPPLLRALCSCSIVYVTFKFQAVQLASLLIERGIIPTNQVDHYHADRTPEERSILLSRFMHGDLKCMVATVAFGMGVDKENVEAVVHLGMPPTIENFVQVPTQESGRCARRPDLEGQCVVYLDHDRYTEMRRKTYMDATSVRLICDMMDEGMAEDQGKGEFSFSSLKYLDWTKKMNISSEAVECIIAGFEMNLPKTLMKHGVENPKEEGLVEIFSKVPEYLVLTFAGKKAFERLYTASTGFLQELFSDKDGKRRNLNEKSAFRVNFLEMCRRSQLSPPALLAEIVRLGPRSGAFKMMRESCSNCIFKVDRHKFRAFLEDRGITRQAFCLEVGRVVGDKLKVLREMMAAKRDACYALLCKARAAQEEGGYDGELPRKLIDIYFASAENGSEQMCRELCGDAESFQKYRKDLSLFLDKDFYSAPSIRERVGRAVKSIVDYHILSRSKRNVKEEQAKLQDPGLSFTITKFLQGVSTREFGFSEYKKDGNFASFCEGSFVELEKVVRASLADMLMTRI